MSVTCPTAAVLGDALPAAALRRGSAPPTAAAGAVGTGGPAARCTAATTAAACSAIRPAARAAARSLCAAGWAAVEGARQDPMQPVACGACRGRVVDVSWTWREGPCSVSPLKVRKERLAGWTRYAREPAYDMSATCPRHVRDMSCTRASPPARRASRRSPARQARPRSARSFVGQPSPVPPAAWSRTISPHISPHLPISPRTACRLVEDQALGRPAVGDGGRCGEMGEIWGDVAPGSGPRRQRGRRRRRRAGGAPTSTTLPVCMERQTTEETRRGRGPLLPPRARPLPRRSGARARRLFAARRGEGARATRGHAIVQPAPPPPRLSPPRGSAPTTRRTAAPPRRPARRPAAPGGAPAA